LNQDLNVIQNLARIERPNVEARLSEPVDTAWQPGPLSAIDRACNAIRRTGRQATKREETQESR